MVQVHVGMLGWSEVEERIGRDQAGSVLNYYGVAGINQLQRVAMEESRLGIPLLFGNDVIHGYRTIFPVPLAMSCTWEPGLVEAAARIAAEEASADGPDMVYAVEPGAFKVWIGPNAAEGLEGTFRVFC
jgi:beta-glucosidase